MSNLEQIISQLEKEIYGDEEVTQNEGVANSRTKSSRTGR